VRSDGELVEYIYTRRIYDNDGKSPRKIHQLKSNLIAIGYYQPSLIQILNLETNQIITNLQDQGGPILTLLSMEYNRLASGSMDTLIKIWHYPSGQLLTSLRGHSGAVWEIISVNLTTLASCSADRTIIIWNVTIHDGKALRTFRGHHSEVKSLCLVSPTNLASASSDWTINIWKINTAIVIKTLYGHLNSVLTLLYLSSRYLASGSEDKTIIIWDIQVGKKIQRIDNGYVTNSLVLLPNDQIAYHDDGNWIDIWNYRSGLFIQTLRGNYRFVPCLIRLYNGHLAAIDQNGIVSIWSFSNSSNYTGKTSIDTFNTACLTNYIEVFI
jgi:WD40 repeat protein